MVPLLVWHALGFPKPNRHHGDATVIRFSNSLGEMAGTELWMKSARLRVTMTFMPDISAQRIVTVPVAASKGLVPL